MNAAVFGHALRQVRRMIAVLAAASGAFYYLVLFASASFLSTGSLGGFFRSPPKAVGAFLGGSANFLEPSGWLAAGMSHPVTFALMTGSALVVAAGAVATEVERGTLDLVLSRPVPRSSFLAAKGAASIVAVTAAEAGGLVGVFLARATVHRMGEIPVSSVIRAFLGSWTLFVAMAMVGLLVSSRSSLRGHAVGTSVGLVVGWFFANFIALLIGGLSWIRFVSPFHYFQSSELIAGRTTSDLAVLAAVALVAAGAAALAFERRDLTR